MSYIYIHAEGPTYTYSHMHIYYASQTKRTGQIPPTGRPEPLGREGNVLVS